MGLALIAAGPQTDEEASSLPAPQGCTTGLAWDGEALWAADRKTDLIYAVDPESGDILKIIEAPGYWPTGLAYDGEQLWVADRDQGTGFRVDPNTGVATRTIELDLGRPEDLAWDGTHLWCVDGKKDLIVKLDPEDGTAIRSFRAPSGNPTGLAYDGRYLWVADRGEDAVFRMDPETGSALARIPSPGPYPYGLAWEGNALRCADYQHDKLDRVDPFGSEPLITSNPRKARLEYAVDLINYGPGTVETADIYIAVPSDGENQKLLSAMTFEPKPAEIVHDRWGQKIVHFRFEDVGAQSRVRAVMRCDVELEDVLYLLLTERAGTLEDIPEDLKAKYLVDGSKYDLKNEYIAETARKLVGDETNVLAAVQRIYDHVIEKLRYELVGGWNTAATVLKRGTGSCSEYTFSFIALCRAAGIPARYAGSVVIRGDDASFDDVFHRWAEVYLPNYGWVPFDPSRGDKVKPADRLKGKGWLANSLFITTRGGGGSEYLGWTYNSEVKWTSRGKCKVKTENIAEWEPLDDKSPP